MSPAGDGLRVARRSCRGATRASHAEKLGPSRAERRGRVGRDRSHLRSRGRTTRSRTEIRARAHGFALLSQRRVVSKRTTHAYGVIGFDATGVLAAPRDGFARHAADLIPLTTSFGIAVSALRRPPSPRRFAAALLVDPDARPGRLDRPRGDRRLSRPFPPISSSGENPWLTPSTFCASVVRLDVVCVAARLDPAPGIETLEIMVEVATTRLALAELPIASVAPPSRFDVGGVPYLAARVTVEIPIKLGG